MSEQITKEELISEIIRLSKQESQTPTQKNLYEKSPYPISQYRKHFGSWNESLKEAGLQINSVGQLNREDFIDDYISVCEEENDGQPVKIETYKEYSKYNSVKTFYDIFDSWEDFVFECGFENYDKRKRYSKEEMIYEIQKYKEETGEIPTVRNFNSYSYISSGTVSNYFGSWNQALKESGLELNIYNLSKEELISEMERISEEFCSKGRPTCEDIKKYSNYPLSQFEKFGWIDILKESGFREVYKQISNEQLKNDVLRVSKEYLDGDGPTINDIDEYGKYSPPTYINRFSGWNSLLEELGFEPYNHPTGKAHPSWEGGYRQYYGSSWRKQRRQAWERDNNSCKVCSISEEEMGKKPDVHHIIPVRYWEVEEEHETMNSMDNIVSLCKSCHATYGKNKKLFKNTVDTFVQEVDKI